MKKKSTLFVSEISLIRVVLRLSFIVLPTVLKDVVQVFRIDDNSLKVVTSSLFVVDRLVNE